MLSVISRRLILMKAAEDAVSIATVVVLLLEGRRYCWVGGVEVFVRRVYVRPANGFRQQALSLIRGAIDGIDDQGSAVEEVVAVAAPL